jgi:hypothetical protein
MQNFNFTEPAPPEPSIKEESVKEEPKEVIEAAEPLPETEEEGDPYKR